MNRLSKSELLAYAEASRDEMGVVLDELSKALDQRDEAMRDNAHKTGNIRQIIQSFRRMSVKPGINVLDLCLHLVDRVEALSEQADAVTAGYRAVFSADSPVAMQEHDMSEGHCAYSVSVLEARQ